MQYFLPLIAVVSGIASTLSFISDLLFAPPERRKAVRILAVVFGLASFFGATLIIRSKDYASLQASASDKVDLSFYQVVKELPFPIQFAGTTFMYVGGLCLTYWTLFRFQVKPLSLQQAAFRVWGSHVARLRSLLLATIICFVLMGIYSGPPLLFDIQKVWYFLLYANDASQYYTPHYGTWFWGEAFLTYAACTMLYFWFAFPHVMVKAWKSAIRVHRKDDQPAIDPRVFISSIYRQLSTLNRDKITHD